MGIKYNLAEIKQEINDAASRAGRDPEQIKIVAVTKTAGLADIKKIIGNGIEAIAESRIQAAQEKFVHIKQEIKKHMIGHLQTNKVKKAVEIFDVIQSVDSVRLANAIDKHAKNIGKVQKIMLQVNVSGEEQKFGFAEDMVAEAYKKIIALPNIKVIGIMCMAPWADKEDLEKKENEIRPGFRKAKDIADSLKLKEISMGMSNDFVIAVEEGSTMVRIGRALFNAAKAN